MRTRRLPLFFRAASAAAGTVGAPAADSIWYTVAQFEGDTYDFGSTPQWARLGTPGDWSVKQVSGPVVASPSFFGRVAVDALHTEMQTTSVAAKNLFVKLMVIGDSITNFYSPVLRDTVTSAGFPSVCWVGNAGTSYRGGSGSPLVDGNGYGGYKFTDLTIQAGQGVPSAGNNHDASDIAAWMLGQAPDLALLHLGSNDGNSTQDLANLLTAHTLLVNALRAHNPNVRIFVAKIIPQVTDTLGLSDPKRSQLDAWAAANTTTASPITIVDQYTGFNQNTMLRDYIHPNDAGIAQMNVKWMAAISPYLTLSSLTPTAATVAMLTLTAPNATLGVGDAATAALPPGVAGDFTFTREDTPILPSGASAAYTDAFPIAASGVNSTTYTGSAADADKRINVIAGNLAFSAGLTATLDTAAVVSFYGTATVGSTVTAALISGATGAVSIKRADGTVAATASSAASVAYTLVSGDMAKLPFTAVARSLTLTVPISSTGTTTSDPAPFVTVQAFQKGATVAAGDVFSLRLADGVSGLINFGSSGAAVTSNTTPQLNAWSYNAQASDAGHAISATVSNLQFTTAPLYGTPVMQSATSAPSLYSLDITADQPGRIRLGYLALGNLDTASVPPTSAFTLSGTVQTAKTIASVSIDNSDPEIKYVYITTSNNFQPADAPTLQYSGTAIRYVGGAAAAGFTLPVFSRIPPPATLMFAGSSSNASSPSAGVFQFAAADQWVTDALFAANQSARIGTTQDCLVQMSILADWGADTSKVRCVGLNAFPPSFGVWYWEQYSLHRVGNTVSLWEKGGNASNAQVGASYTFASPGPLSLAYISRQRSDNLVRLCTSIDGGSTWTQRAVSAGGTASLLYPTAYSNSTTVPVTGVATTGFAT